MTIELDVNRFAVWGLAPNTRKIALLIAERMPHLKFAVWDLSDFMPGFHNVRRNLIFIETEKIALDEVRRVIETNPELGNYEIFLGELKPKNVGRTTGSPANDNEDFRDAIVIIARKDFIETANWKGNIHMPSIERRVVDLLAYSLRDWLPISVDEAIDAFIWAVKQQDLKINSLQRYATRRYLGWALGIILAKLKEKGEIEKIDSRYIASGQRNLHFIKRVEEL